MARKATRNPQQNPAGIDEAGLTKGELRKLNALRKSLGTDIADRAFLQWMKTQAKAGAGEPRDKNAEMIAESLGALVMARKCRIPRGGYILRRGRGRVIVEAVGGGDG
jgi:hypothetical protein